MKSTRKTDLHLLLPFAALTLSFGLRLIRLGHLPLSDAEATLALQALGAVRHTKPLFGAFPAYVGLTSVGFNLFAASDFLARLWPALVGSFLVLVPFLFRKVLGRWPAALLALIFAISPEMVGLSRLIGSPMMALGCMLLAFGFFIGKKAVGAGIFLTLALMSGPGFWMGAVILGVSYLISRWLFLRASPPPEPGDGRDEIDWGHLALAAVVTLVVVGSGFFQTPANLGGGFSGLVAFISGFGNGTGDPAFFIPLALVAYALPSLMLGLLGSIRAILSGSRLDLFFVVWWLVGLAFILLYPAGSATDLIWVTTPLWALTARLLVSAWRLPDKDRGVMVVTAIVVVTVFAFLLIAFRSLVGSSLVADQFLTFLLALLGGLVLLIAVVLLVSFGWSQEVALPGLLLGLGVVFALGGLAFSARTTGLAPEPADELWYPHERRASARWLRGTLDQVAGWNARREQPVDILVAGFDTPALRWFLREDAPVAFVPYAPPQSQPGVVIRNEPAPLELSGHYRGQDLVWSFDVRWQEMTGLDWLRWLLTREAQTTENVLIVWVRTDLLPDNQFRE